MVNKDECIIQLANSKFAEIIIIVAFYCTENNIFGITNKWVVLGYILIYPNNQNAIDNLYSFICIVGIDFIM